jgi:hypothetical protein
MTQIENQIKFCWQTMGQLIDYETGINPDPSLPKDWQELDRVRAVVMKGNFAKTRQWLVEELTNYEGPL